MIVVEMTESTFVHSHLTRNAGNAMAARLLAHPPRRSGVISTAMAFDPVSVLDGLADSGVRWEQR